MKQTWGVYSLCLEALLGSRQAGGLGQQKCFEIEDQVHFSAPGMDQLTGMAQAGSLGSSSAGRAVEDSELNMKQS